MPPKRTKYGPIMRPRTATAFDYITDVMVWMYGSAAHRAERN